MQSILIVEDNAHKREKVIDFIKSILPTISIDVAYSFTSGSKKALENVYDVLILDISLPTYDKTEKETGGRNRAFGGHEIARKIVRRNIRTQIIFITQFDSFSDESRSHTIDSLENLLKKDCGDNFLGFVRYDSSLSAWKDILNNLLRKVVK